MSKRLTIPLHRLEKALEAVECRIEYLREDFPTEDWAPYADGMEEAIDIIIDDLGAKWEEDE